MSNHFSSSAPPSQRIMAQQGRPRICGVYPLALNLVRFPMVLDTKTRIFGIVALICSLLTCILPIAAAQARPGTPNEVRSFVTWDNALCYSFQNRASEPVVFDIDYMPQGASRFIFAQSRRCQQDPVCRRVVEHREPFYQRGQTITMCTNSVRPSTRLCLRVIAREWNNGDPQSGHVSDNWSAWTCAQVPQR